MVRRTRPGAIPRESEFRFDASHRPGMTAKGRQVATARTGFGSVCCRLARNSAGNFGVQHLFQPVQRLGHQGGVGNPVIPAQHDIDGLVRLFHPVAQDKRPRAHGMELAGAIGGHRGRPQNCRNNWRAGGRNSARSPRTGGAAAAAAASSAGSSGTPAPRRSALPWRAGSARRPPSAAFHRAR